MSAPSLTARLALFRRRKPPARPCVHCRGRAAVPRRGGLCRRCLDTPEVKALYPASKFARRGVGHGKGGLRLPDEPTAALPGSAEKVAVLEERARLGVALHHPDDARLPRVARQGERVFRVLGIHT